MHIHSKDNKFLDPVVKCIQNDIFKFDSSIRVISGCSFAEDNAYRNISTIRLRLVNFLSLYTNYSDVEKN